LERPASRATLLAVLVLVAPSADARDTGGDETDRLLARIESLEARLDELAALRKRVATLEAELALAQRSRDTVLPTFDGNGVDRLAEPEGAVPPEPAPEGIRFGGALRFTGYTVDYDEAVETRRGTSGLDLFRVNASGELDGFLLSAEYRFYPFMDVLHHGWVGYEFVDESRLELGVTRVPFGLLPYAAHNFWFGVPYYLGLSDDYDLGAKYVRQDGAWATELAFFKNPEVSSPADLGRYSFDVVNGGGTTNEEINQFNARVARTLGAGSSCSHEIGVSGQAGELYNGDTGERGDHWAAAAHLDTRCGRWNVQLQAAHYRYDPANPPGVSRETVRLGAFETSYDVAAEGTVYVANLAYNLPVPWDAIDQITCYTDYRVVVKAQDGFADSELNTTGCLLGVGLLYVYLDLIQARNMVFFGEGSLAGGGSRADWDTRFNVNVGYYW
jgi:hypothetical protein